MRKREGEGRGKKGIFANRDVGFIRVDERCCHKRNCRFTRAGREREVEEKEGRKKESATYSAFRCVLCAFVIPNAASRHRRGYCRFRSSSQDRLVWGWTGARKKREGEGRRKRGEKKGKKGWRARNSLLLIDTCSTSLISIFYPLHERGKDREGKKGREKEEKKKKRKGDPHVTLTRDHKREKDKGKKGKKTEQIFYRYPHSLHAEPAVTRPP